MYREKENTSKNTTAKEAFATIMDNKIIKIGLIVAVSIGGLYILSKAFKVVGNTVSSFKSMTDSFRS